MVMVHMAHVVGGVGEIHRRDNGSCVLSSPATKGRSERRAESESRVRPGRGAGDHLPRGVTAAEAPGGDGRACWLQTPAEKPLLLEVQRRAGTLDATSPAADASLGARDPGRILSRSVLIA